MNKVLIDTPSGTPVMPVKAYYHEAPNEHGGLNKSVGLEVRKAFIDAPLVLEADALARIACLEGEIAKRDAALDEVARLNAAQAAPAADAGLVEALERIAHGCDCQATEASLIELIAAHSAKGVV